MTKLLSFFVLFFMVSLAAQAQDKFTPYPRVFAWSHGIDLTIDNFSEDDYSCSGPIYIRYTDGTSDSEYYSGHVLAKSSVRRYFQNRRVRNRIVSAYDSIFCFKL